MAQDGGKVVSLTYRPILPPGNTPGNHFCYRLSRTQGHTMIGRIMSMKNSSDTTWNRNSDLPICNTAVLPRKKDSRLHETRKINIKDYNGQQRFWPMWKNICFWRIFGRRIRISFQNFSITHTFRSTLKGWNFLRQDTKVCFYHVRREEFKDFFSQEDCVMFCNDVCSVMEVLGHECNPDQWGLSTDSSKVSLKVVLLHNGNKFPSVPLAHAANMKESYESMKLLLGKIKYHEFKWKLRGDLKVVALLLGMQLGYTKYCCFLCEWDFRDKKSHHVNKLWPKRTSLTPGEKNVIKPLLVLPENIFLPPLHIKLGLMKNTVKGRGFEYLRNKFRNVSDAKIKEGIFIGPQIRELMQDNSSMKIWMRQKETHGCLLRGFARTS